MQVMGIEEPLPTIMEENYEGEQDDSKFKFEDICEDAPESKIQSVPWLLRVKLFMSVMKAAWSQLGGMVGTVAGGADGADRYGGAGGAA